MGLFSSNNRKNGHFNGENVPNPSTAATIDIPEDVFIEPENTQESKKTEPVESSLIKNTINELFDFLERNHESKGYDDALINPDSSHLEQNIRTLENELSRVIRRVKTYYQDFIREIDFHISTRSRSGMVDTVEELLMKKTIAEDHIKKVMEIEEDAKKKEGDSQGIIMSYTRGFKNGLAAISHHTILKRKL